MPLFSILLPSKDRLSLLRLAVPSVLRQNFRDFEIIVSDNNSSDDYDSYLKNLHDRRIKYFRTDSLISVTANWNNALRMATGTYVLMLGDDDALSPGLLTKLAKIVKSFNRPQVVYMKAYHYLYPGVSNDVADGCLREISNSPLFSDHDAPYRLDIDCARDFARAAVSFRHLVSFNAQHFVWRRDFTEAANHRFFEPPYPDYFACFYTFAKATDIVVVPEPSVIIGISKQSFGYFFLNNRQEEGARLFAGETLTAADFGQSCDAEMVSGLKFPGPVHYRNWLLTSMQFTHKVDPSFSINFDRYYKIQIVEAILYCFSTANTQKSLLFSVRNDWKKHWSFVRHAWSRLASGVRAGQLNQFRSDIILGELDVYFPASVKDIPMNSHHNILDAFDHLHKDIRPTSLGDRFLAALKSIRLRS